MIELSLEVKVPVIKIGFHYGEPNKKGGIYEKHETIFY